MKSVKKDHFYKVVVVGGGFGGVKTALRLAKDRRSDVTLVSDRDSLLYYPLLFSTATGSSRKVASVPLSKIFKNNKVKVVRDTVIGIDASRKIIVGEAHQYQYDSAVFALGSATNYFGIQALKERSWHAKTEDGIQALRRHLHDELTTTKHYDKQYVVIGAGPTGVALAASLKDFLQRVGDGHELKRHNVNITLVEAAPRVLPRMSVAASNAALKRLNELGVNVLLGTIVKRLDDKTLIAGKMKIPIETVIWTSGVSNHPFYSAHLAIFRVNGRGAVLVNEFLEASPDIFVIGDNAATKHAGFAQTALHNGTYASKVIRKRISGERPTPYIPKRPFSAVPIGHKWAVVERGPVHMWGFSAATIHKIANFITCYEILPLNETLNFWLRNHETIEFGCELCQKNNDSSRVAPSS